jgi:hypothetical protein
MPITNFVKDHVLTKELPGTSPLAARFNGMNEPANLPRIGRRGSKQVI